MTLHDALWLRLRQMQPGSVATVRGKAVVRLTPREWVVAGSGTLTLLPAIDRLGRPWQSDMPECRFQRGGRGVE
jgi:hypothetical protein